MRWPSPRTHVGVRGSISVSKPTPLSAAWVRHRAAVSASSSDRSKGSSSISSFPASIFERSRNVVDECEQEAGAVRGDCSEAFLFDGQLRSKEELDHAEDAVHGGADLVAHRREEAAFGGVRVGRRLAASSLLLRMDSCRAQVDLLQLLLGPCVGGHVPICADHAESLSRGVSLDDGEGVNVAQGTVWPDHPDLRVELLFTEECGPEFLEDARVVSGIDDGLPCGVIGSEMLSLDTEDAQHLIVPEELPGVYVEVEDANGAGLECEREPVGRFSEPRFRPGASP